MPRRFDFSNLDPSEIAQLMKLLAGTDVEECEIEQGEYRISIRRVAAPREGADRADAGEPRQREETLEEPRVVLAPAVGVFYRSERRSDPASVEVGARVRVGDVLGSIEVMGVPHSVPSTLDGVVEGFLVENGEPVEYGQPIVAISDQPSAIS